MRPDPLKIVDQAATGLMAAAMLRDGCAAAVGALADGLSASFAILARPAEDSGLADVLASSGLHAADFRRTESRLPKSSLWRILRAATPFVIDDLTQEPTLNFLAYTTRALVLLAVPVMPGHTVSALLAIAFEKTVDEHRTLSLMETVATLIAHSMRVDQTVVSDNERLLNENRQLKAQLKARYDFGNLIGNSGGMRQALDQVRQIARSNATVLLRGEPGTGKDTLANAIRYNSLRSKRPFIKLSFTLTPASQQLNEIHTRSKEAEGGTLLLDEIASATLEAQQLLHELMLDVRSATRDEPPRYNVRFIAATGRDIDDGQIDPQLREELTSFTIFLPPLRERKSDVLLLADHFLERFAAVRSKNILRIATPAIDMLTAYHFPGNVRELENAIEHAVDACDSNVVHGHHLPPTLQTAEVTGTETRITLDSAVARFERDLIQDALKSTCGNVARAARMLESTERILGYKMRKYGINANRFKKWR